VYDMFGVVFEGGFVFCDPFCTAFGEVFCCNEVFDARPPETSKPDTASRIRVLKIFWIIRLLLYRSGIPGLNLRIAAIFWFFDWLWNFLLVLAVLACSLHQVTPSDVTFRCALQAIGSST